MKIYPISTNQLYKSSVRENKLKERKIGIKDIQVTDSFTLSEPKNNVNLSFEASPVRLYMGDWATKSKISGKEAIQIFENFKSGNYLNLNGGIKSWSDSNIRIQNLSFLDKVIDRKDKQEFVDYYKSLTGFPNLYSVAYYIKEQFKTAVNKSEEYLKYYSGKNSDYYTVMSMGYDGVSSVAKYKALPGSDLDKAFVILKGHPFSESYNNRIVDEFRGQLWDKTDQRVLSYNHDADSFPKIYTEQQVINLVKKMEKANEPSILETIIPGMGFARLIDDIFFKEDEPPRVYNYDYVDANSLFIKICKRFPKSGNWEMNSEKPSRENIYSFGFIAEVLYRGTFFQGVSPSVVKNSDVIKMLNVSQINALKNSEGNKDKYLQREALERNFYYWDIDKQFRFIKSLILASCGENTEFPEYFASNTKDKFMKLMRAVGL